jgi:hypothetical protein
MMELTLNLMGRFKFKVSLKGSLKLNPKLKLRGSFKMRLWVRQEVRDRISCNLGMGCKTRRQLHCCWKELRNRRRLRKKDKGNKVTVVVIGGKQWLLWKRLVKKNLGFPGALQCNCRVGRMWLKIREEVVLVLMREDQMKQEVWHMLLCKER